MSNFNKIAIVGNGLSAWMMCAFMAKQLQHTDTKITLYVGVESESTQDLQSPLPLINEFFKAIEILPEALVDSARLHPKLGTAYLFDGQAPFIHVWGQYGAPIGAVEFHQIVMRSMQQNHPVDLNKLSIAAASVLAGRFQKPTQNFQSIFSTYESSWSFETEAFLQFLKTMSLRLGVEVSEEKISRIGCDDGEYVLGELNVPYKCDYLINTVPGLMLEEHGVESWFASMPFELKSQTKKNNALSALVNKVKAVDETSWVCEVSHRNLAVLNAYHFTDRDSGEVYVHKAPRASRCLNFGPAMANMHSPLFSTIDLNLIVLKLLLRYFPSPSDDCSVVGEFNKAFRGSLENLRDITQLSLNTLFAKSNLKNSAIPLTSSASYKASLFGCRGRYPVLENEFFKTEWQVWLFLGLGFKFDGTEPMVSFIDEKTIKEHIGKVEASVMKNLPLTPLVN